MPPIKKKGERYLQVALPGTAIDKLKIAADLNGMTMSALLAEVIAVMPRKEFAKGAALVCGPWMEPKLPPKDPTDDDILDATLSTPTEDNDNEWVGPAVVSLSSPAESN